MQDVKVKTDTTEIRSCLISVGVCLSLPPYPKNSIYNLLRNSTDQCIQFF